MPERSDPPSRPLALDEDLAFQRRIWRIQRIGWVGLALVVVAGLLGLFGGGPLSRAAAGDPAGPLSIDSERFCRREATTTLRVNLRAQPAPDGTAAVVFDDAYLDAIAIEQVVPPPEGSERRPEGVSFRFRLPPNGSPTVAIFLVRLRRAGIVHARLSAGGRTVGFRQLVYP